MKLSELKKGEIRRKTNLDDDIRTPGKDDAADWIEENIIEEGTWPVNVTDIEDDAGYSRQHLTNVVKEYFEPGEAGEDTQESAESAKRGGVTITVPDDVKDEESFLRGVAEGRRV